MQEQSYEWKGALLGGLTEDIELEGQERVSKMSLKKEISKCVTL